MLYTFIDISSGYKRSRKIIVRYWCARYLQN